MLTIKAVETAEMLEQKVDALEAEQKKTIEETKTLICKMVKANVPYSYLKMATAALDKQEEQGKELFFLSTDMWLLVSDLVLKAIREDSDINEGDFGSATTA